VGNRVSRFLSSPSLSIALPPIVGLYFGMLDYWGSDWDVFSENRATHELLLLMAAAFTIIVLFFRGISEALEGRVARRYNFILEETMAFMNELIKKKRDRFQNKARHLRRNGNTFALITHPQDQLEHVLDGTSRLLKQSFGIDQKNISATIILGDQTANKWWYLLKSDSQKQHTRAKELMSGSSTARYCFDTGESIFIPDIRKGSKEDAFLKTERSSKSKFGSIYCKPIRVTVNGLQYIYIFSICIYGQHLCTPYDEEECRACERLLDEIAARVELELCLYSIKTFVQTGAIK